MPNRLELEAIKAVAYADYVKSIAFVAATALVKAYRDQKAVVEAVITAYDALSDYDRALATYVAAIDAIEACGFDTE